MSLKLYLKKLPDDPAREHFASACGSTISYLRLVAYGSRQASLELAQRIEVESCGAVPVESLVSDPARLEAMRRFVDGRRGDTPPPASPAPCSAFAPAEAGGAVARAARPAAAGGKPPRDLTRWAVEPGNWRRFFPALATDPERPAAPKSTEHASAPDRRASERRVHERRNRERRSSRPGKER